MYYTLPCAVANSWMIFLTFKTLLMKRLTLLRHVLNSDTSALFLGRVFRLQSIPLTPSCPLQ